MEKNMCTDCEKWKAKQAEVLMYCATVFDVDLDMRVFETECKKSCPFGNNS